MTSAYHTPITNGAAANAAVINAPLAALDSAIGTAMAASLLARDSILTAGTAATLANGAANAGQKVVTVDDASVFVAGATVEYALVGGVIETNTIATVDSATQITLTTNIGTGGIPDNGLIAVVPPAYENMRTGIANVLDYGALGDGSTDDSTAVAAAIAALPADGGRLRFPAGTYVCSVELPDHPKTLILEGDGPRTSILQAKAANTVIIQGCPTVTAGIGTPKHIIRDIGLKAHASGSTGAAVQGNMSWHVFENIDLYDNGAGKFTYGFLLTDAGSQHCYANTFSHIRVYHQDGPTTALFTVQNSANLQFFDHIFVSNGTTATGPATVFDLPTQGYGEHYYITNGHFEGVPGTIVVPSDATWIQGCYFEDIKAGKYVVDGGGGRDQYLVYLIGNKFGGTTGNQFNNAGNYVYMANRGVTISGVNGGLSMGVHDSTIAQQVAATAIAQIWSNTGYAGELRLNQSGVRTWTLRNTATSGILQFDNGDPLRVSLLADGKLIANVGLGVGNSAAATTPGNVVKKIEVFDASGNSLGFLAVYDGITA